MYQINFLLSRSLIALGLGENFSRLFFVSKLPEIGDALPRREEVKIQRGSFIHGFRVDLASEESINLVSIHHAHRWAAHQIQIIVSDLIRVFRDLNRSYLSPAHGKNKYL
jgi:hypothetical protein